MNALIQYSKFLHEKKKFNIMNFCMSKIVLLKKKYNENCIIINNFYFNIYDSYTYFNKKNK